MVSAHGRNISGVGRSHLSPVCGSHSHAPIIIETQLANVPHVHNKAEYADSIHPEVITASLASESRHGDDDRSSRDQVPPDATAENSSPVLTVAPNLPGALIAGARETELDEENELETVMLRYDVTKLP